MHIRASIMTLSACAALGACQAQNEDPAEPESGPDTEASPSPETGERVSILRPDVEAEQGLQPAQVEPLDLMIGFPQGGNALDDAAITTLEGLLGSPQIELGGPIQLRGHSDSAGSDEANMRASQDRAETVRDWLVDNGVNEGRIAIIAFGEQNPLEPNALPDGLPDEGGRAANRRVEIHVDVPENATQNPAN
ncbi:MAG: OmpA family protein [Erythrobacter sp.]